MNAAIRCRETQGGESHEVHAHHEALDSGRSPAAAPPGPYGLQAAIALQHARARTADATDWRRIWILYDWLMIVAGSPVVELNRAVAVSMVDGPEAGLAAIEAIDGLDGYVHLHSTRADLCAKAGRREEAIAAYGRALELATSETERAFFRRRLSEVEAAV